MEGIEPWRRTIYSPLRKPKLPSVSCFVQNIVSMSAIQQRRKNHKHRDRRCDVCKIQTDGISHFCSRHLKRRGKHGSVKVTSYVNLRDYAHLIKLARKHLKAHPPDSAIIESMARLLQPPAYAPPGVRGRREQNALRDEMVRWTDARYQKKRSNPNKYGTVYYFKHDYSPRGILCVLIGLEAYFDERQGVGFPNDSEGIERALNLPWSRRHLRSHESAVGVCHGQTEAAGVHAGV